MTLPAPPYLRIRYGYPKKDLAEDAKTPPRKKGLEGVVTKLP